MPYLDDGTETVASSFEPVAELGRRPHVDLVLLALLVVIAGLVARHQQPQGVGHVGDRHAQVGRLGAVDRHAVLRLAHHQRRIDVDGAGRLAERLHHFLRVLVQ